jgi:predicted DCC family thiol-disulfide oxidoreductase YuxK
VCAESVGSPDLGVASGDRDEPEELVVVYDGECPFCTRFVQFYRIRQLVGRVRLLDARGAPDSDPVLAEVRDAGLDLDIGMVVKWRGRLYHGPDAMHVLALLGAEGTVFGRINRALFTRPALARRIYPALVAGRRATLRLLGRTQIGDR